MNGQRKVMLFFKDFIPNNTGCSLEKDACELLAKLPAAPPSLSFSELCLLMWVSLLLALAYFLLVLRSPSLRLSHCCRLSPAVHLKHGDPSPPLPREETLVPWYKHTVLSQKSCRSVRFFWKILGETCCWQNPCWAARTAASPVLRSRSY